MEAANSKLQFARLTPNQSIPTEPLDPKRQLIAFYGDCKAEWYCDLASSK